MIIAIDIDEVLANTIEQVILFCDEEYSLSVVEHDLSGRYFSFMGETWEESNKKYFKFCESKYAGDILPVDGAVEAIERLVSMYDLVAITGRPAFTREQTSRWINRYFPKKFKKIIYNNDRTDPSDYAEYWGRTKAEICDEIGAGVLIDDLPMFMEDSSHLRVYLFDQPWNKDDAPAHAIRVKSWQEIVQKLS